MKYNIGSKSLTLNGKSYKAVSGPHGAGTLPKGKYSVKTRQVVTGANMSSSYCAGGVCFFIPIEPLFNAKGRSGFGIHPDGNVPGTLGCIGIVRDDAKKFFDAWMQLSLSNRPASLEVRD